MKKISSLAFLAVLSLVATSQLSAASQSPEEQAALEDAQWSGGRTSGGAVGAASALTVSGGQGLHFSSRQARRRPAVAEPWRACGETSLDFVKKAPKRIGLSLLTGASVTVAAAVGAAAGLFGSLLCPPAALVLAPLCAYYSVKAFGEETHYFDWLRKKWK